MEGMQRHLSASPMSSSRGRRIGTAVLVGCLLAVGGWLRVRNLGALGLIADEGIQAEVVQGILEHGLPRMDSGQVYARAVPFLYLEAAAARLFGLNEFSLRLPAALFGVAAIWVSFLLGRTVFNAPVGLLLAALMAFSTWEVEISRYARFYTVFQCLYLAALLAFYRGYLLGHGRWRAWFIVAAALAFTMHDLGVMLAVCCLIPIFSDAFTPRRKLAFAAGAAALAGAWALYSKLLMGWVKRAFAAPVDAAVVGYVGPTRSSLMDFFLAPDLSGVAAAWRAHPVELMAVAAVAAIASAALLYRAARGDGWRAALAIPVLWAAFAHQFALAAVLVGIYLAVFVRAPIKRTPGVTPPLLSGAREVWRVVTEPPLMIAGGVAGVCLAFWVPVVMPGMADASPAASALLGYPAVYDYLFYWLIRGWPVMTAVFLAGAGWLALRFAADRLAIGPLFAVGAVAIPAVATGFLRAESYEARYFFHLYPLILLVAAAIAVELGSRLLGWLRLRPGLWRGAVAGALALAALVASQDADPAKAWAIGERTYRSARDPIRGHLNSTGYAQFHQDQKSPSLYVRERLRPDDVVVAIGRPHKIVVYHHYVGRVDYSVEEPAKWYQLRMADGTVREHVTGTRIIESVEQLQALLARTAPRGVWLVGDQLALGPDAGKYTEPMKAYLRRLAGRPDYMGLDDQTFAVKIR